jgi:hypothetical protein
MRCKQCHFIAAFQWLWQVTASNLQRRGNAVTVGLVEPCLVGAVPPLQQRGVLQKLEDVRHTCKDCAQTVQTLCKRLANVVSRLSVAV